MMSSKIKRIEVKNLSKRFHAEYKGRTSALSFFVDLIAFKRQKKDIFIADNISFDVYSGEVLGIVGRNGSGKSSLLRLIAEIYKPDLGSIRTYGKVVYLSGFGHGLVPKLTMRENIFLMGSILGLSQKEIKNKFDDIVEFSGLEDHLDMKVYQFSTGMLSRLNFSVVIHCVNHHNPDIILVDEVFSSGGDADFQDKAIKKMEELIKGGAAVLLVSHDMEILKKYCHEVLWIGDGKIVERGLASHVVDRYLNDFR